MKGDKRKGEHRSKGTRRNHNSGVVLVVGDGVTEKTYFRRLSVLCESVGIRPVAAEVNGPNKIIRKTESIVQENDLSPKDGDLVAIVMDLDNRYTREEIVRMDEECSKKGFHLFISNPCFEVWLLSHFRIPTHPYDQREIVADLERELGRPYRKSVGFDIDDDMVDRATGNSKRLLPDDECTPGGCYDRNPSTMVHSLVDSIRKLVRRYD